VINKQETHSFIHPSIHPSIHSFIHSFIGRYRTMSPRAEINRPRRQVSCFFVPRCHRAPLWPFLALKTRHKRSQGDSAPLAESDYRGLPRCDERLPSPSPAAPIASTSREMNRSTITSRALHCVQCQSVERHTSSSRLLMLARVFFAAFISARFCLAEPYLLILILSASGLLPE